MNASRRRGTTTRSGVVAGSVWESRMKIDEVKGGIKVFNGEENRGDCSRLKWNRSVGTVEKRRTWKSVDGIEKSPIPIRKTKSDSKRISEEKNKGFGGFTEKMVSKSLSNVGPVRSRKLGGGDDVDDDNLDDDDEDEEVDEIEEDIEIEKNSIDIKEVNSSEEKLKPKLVSSEEKEIDQIDGSMVFGGEEQKMDQILGSMVSSQEKKIDPTIIDQVAVGLSQKKKIEEKQIDQVVGSIGSSQEKEIDQIHEIREMPISHNVHKIKRATIDHPKIDTFLKNPQPPIISVADEEPFEIRQETHNRMQNIVDLVMWRDISKSAFIFGFGTFIILSSSFAKDLNFSLISAISYLGLAYLAAIYLFKSIICRGAIEIENVGQTYVVGEEEAVWLLKLILPYINELLFKLRGLFSGDPATTMKLSVFLFVLARCGSSITIWKMAKMAFFGVFTVPKICSSYSAQLTGYGKFWIRRFQDAWDSCTQKKAVAAAVFTVIWNLSSIVARIWAVFMLIVAVRCYQLSMREEWAEEVEQVREEGQEQRQRQRWKVTGPGPTTLMDVPKGKKGS